MFLRKGLQPPYDEYDTIVQRSEKLYKVQVKGENITISINTLNPEFLAFDSNATMSSSTDDYKSGVYAELYVL